jgi:hypothetical protein
MYAFYFVFHAGEPFSGRALISAAPTITAEISGLSLETTAKRKDAKDAEERKGENRKAMLTHRVTTICAQSH